MADEERRKDVPEDEAHQADSSSKEVGEVISTSTCRGTTASAPGHAHVSALVPSSRKTATNTPMVSESDLPLPDFKDQVRNRSIEAGNASAPRSAGPKSKAQAKSEARLAMQQLRGLVDNVDPIGGPSFKDQVSDRAAPVENAQLAFGDPPPTPATVVAQLMTEPPPAMVPAQPAPIDESLLREIERLREMEQQPVIQAELAPPEDHGQREPTQAKDSVRNHRILFAVVFCLLVVAGLAFGLVFGMDDDDKSPATPAPTPSPLVTPAPTQSPTIPRLDALREILLPLSGPSLFNESTAQYQALKWLAHDDDAVLPPVNSQELMERFILAVLYFATDGREWDNEFKFLQHLSVCDWHGPSEYDGVNCTAGGSVSAIHLGTFKSSGVSKILKAIKLITLSFSLR